MINKEKEAVPSFHTYDMLNVSTQRGSQLPYICIYAQNN